MDIDDIDTQQHEQALLGYIIGILQDQTSLSPTEIQNRVDNLKQTYDGLVNDVAAAYLLSYRNDIDPNTALNIEPDQPETGIADLIDGMNHVTLQATVDEIYSANSFSSGKVRNVIIRDNSGKTQLTLWNEDTGLADNLDEGQNIKIHGAYTKEDDYVKENYDADASLQLGSNSYIEDQNGNILVDTRE